MGGTHGQSLINVLFKGLVYTYSNDRGITTDIADVCFLLLPYLGPGVVLTITAFVASLPIAEISNEAKGVFMTKVEQAIADGGVGRLGAVLVDFSGAYQRRNLIARRG